MWKRVLIFISVALCILLFTSCTAPTEKSVSVATEVISNVETKLKESQNYSDEVFSMPDGAVTVQEFVCYSRYNARVIDSTYDAKDTITETVKSFALVAEAKERGITLPDEKKQEIANYSQQYVNELYDTDFPVEIYQEICRDSYLKSALMDQIQQEIISGNLQTNDKQTMEAYTRYAEFTQEIEKQSENWSDERKEKELGNYADLYNDVENTYIDSLITKYLSLL